MKWKTPETAPKDGTMILGDFGWRWPLVAVWNNIDKKWVTASLQGEETPFREIIDYWFENEREGAEDLKYWMPLPKLCLR